MDQKLVLTDSSRMTTGHGRVGQNRLLNGVEPHTTGCVWFDPVFSTLRISMNRLRFRFEPKREKNRTEPDFQTLCKLNIKKGMTVHSIELHVFSLEAHQVYECTSHAKVCLQYSILICY